MNAHWQVDGTIWPPQWQGLLGRKGGRGGSGFCSFSDHHTHFPSSMLGSRRSPHPNKVKKKKRGGGVDLCNPKRKGVHSLYIAPLVYFILNDQSATKVISWRSHMPLQILFEDWEKKKKELKEPGRLKLGRISCSQQSMQSCILMCNPGTHLKRNS